MRKDQTSLFDLLLEEGPSWEALDPDQQHQAIDIFARLIANAVVHPDNQEKEDE